MDVESGGGGCGGAGASMSNVEVGGLAERIEPGQSRHRAIADWLLRQ
jgi:hypothetical protein